MINTKSLIAAALLSTLAAVSFAQAPAAKAAPAATAPAAVAAAPADTASMPMHQKKKHTTMMKHDKKAKVDSPAAASK